MEEQNNPKVIICMSTYNGEKYVKEQIESLLNQTYKNLEIYVRDDGSKDNTINILEEYEKNNKIHFIKGNNVGVVKSFYECLKEAYDNAEYFAYCDQDDKWHEDKIERSISKLKKENLKYTIYDENGYMNYDNSLLPDNMLTYKPFATEQEYITSRAFTQDTDSEYPAAIAELSVGRLMKDKKPELNITNTETGEQLIKNLDMIKYLNMLKQEHYKDMELQEYLDREDRYSMIFFVDENLTLIKSVIQINGWVIQLNDFEL